MGHLRLSDAFLPPSLLSMLRFPLAALFVAVREEPLLALSVLAAAGLTDVLDGWWARRYHQATATGAIIDPIADKSFVAIALGTLVLDGTLPVWGLLLLAAREIGELPLLAWALLSRARRRRRAEQAAANWTGKAATVLQFASISAVLLRSELATSLLIMTGVVGVAAALLYAVRELRDEAARPVPRAGTAS
jgi:CDP-diacylglycerol--glycerol-3-phosphate 3-phosphatidyltransferase/cardiolipin synthase